MSNANPIEARNKYKSNAWKQVFIEQKLNNWLGYLLFFFIAIGMGYLMANQLTLGLGLTGLICSMAVIMICMISAEAGLYINVLYSFFAFHFSRLLFHDNFPVGVASDVLIVATLFSFFVRRVALRQSVNKFSKTPVAKCIFVLVGYMAIQLFNPYAHSFDGWYQTMRKLLDTVIILFIAYNVFDSYDNIKRFLTVLFILCAITGIYGCIQQWHGLFNFEIDWVTSDENRYGLTFINGEFRKFSTMSDPTAYGVIMASCSILFLIIAINQKRFAVKATLIIGAIFMLLGMAYSQTRTANAMAMAGLALFVLLTINKTSTKISAIIGAGIFLLLLYGPFYNNTITRFRTTFMGSQDESFKVREVNRSFIQPYIYSHPIGGGLCTTGGNGLRFNPGHYLAGFPPDSGYLKKALETGWIGLAIICILYFTVLKTGIRGYFSCKDQRIKAIYAACTASIFSFYVAEFSQDAIGQITDLVVYYPLIAILLRLKDFDHKKQILPI
ncbi:MAG TPA: O-antigen ligase family protein [Flavipsychrobacter sp.]|nr:O-antigen ligase family protein [Flavipsychrobacter sp.]